MSVCLSCNYWDRQIHTVSLRTTWHEIIRNKTGQSEYCKYNTTWRFLLLNTVAVECNKTYIFWVCVCSLRYPVYNAYASYCYLCPSRLIIFFHIFSLTKKKLLKMTCVAIFFYNCCLKHFSLQVELSEIWSKMFTGCHIKQSPFLSEFNLLAPTLFFF